LFLHSFLGLALTAKHVVEEFLHDANGGTPRDSLAAIYMWPRKSADEEVRTELVPVKWISRNSLADIALLRVAIGKNKDTGKLWPVGAAKIQLALPRPGNGCMALGFDIIGCTKDDGISITLGMSATVGRVTEVFFPYRGGYGLRTPSFQTDARFDSGMSGGPVFDRDTGRIIGVISSGVESAEGSEDISYAYAIGSALAIKIPSSEPIHHECGDLLSMLQNHSDVVEWGSVKIRTISDTMVFDYSVNPSLVTLRNAPS
jgi:S1-C subfamily serine protease